MIFTTQAMASKTVMICKPRQDATTDKLYFRLVKPVLGESNVQEKWKGKWFDWNSPRGNELKPSELEIYDSAAKLTVYYKPDETFGIRKEMEILIDFEFGTRTVTQKSFASGKELKDVELNFEWPCEIQ